MTASPGRGNFATTHWSLVLAAAREEDRDGRLAMDSLCERYWYPLYVFVRRRGYSAEDAQDLTQAFFTRLLDKGDVARASPARGRFRSFLLASLQNFLINEYDRARALKRGGGVPVSSIDMTDAEERYVAEPASDVSPEDQFHRKWALTLLDRALNQIRLEYRAQRQVGALRPPRRPHDRRRSQRFAPGSGCRPRHDRGCGQGRPAPVAEALSRHPPEPDRGDRWRRRARRRDRVPDTSGGPSVNSAVTPGASAGSIVIGL